MRLAGGTGQRHSQCESRTMMAKWGKTWGLKQPTSLAQGIRGQLDVTLNNERAVGTNGDHEGVLPSFQAVDERWARPIR